MTPIARVLAGATAFLVGVLIGWGCREVGDRIVVAMLLSRPRRWAP